MVDGSIFKVQVFKNTDHTVDCVCSLVLWLMNHAGLNEQNPLGKCLDGYQDGNCSQWLDPVRQANHVRAMTSPPCFLSSVFPSSHHCYSPSTWHSAAACTPQEKERHESSDDWEIRIKFKAGVRELIARRARWMDGGEKVHPGIWFLFTVGCTYGNRLPVFNFMPVWLPREKAITCLSSPAPWHRVLRWAGCTQSRCPPRSFIVFVHSAVSSELVSH